jgi:hypothetical protein
MEYAASERAFWLARIAGCTVVLKQYSGHKKVVANYATVIKKAREKAENPPSYVSLKSWWEQLPDEEQLRLHETYGGNYLFVDGDSAEDSLAQARNLAKAASPALIEEMVSLAMKEDEKTTDRIAAAKLVFQVGGGLTEAPQLTVNVDARETSFMNRLKEVLGTPQIAEDTQRQIIDVPSFDMAILPEKPDF